METRRLQKTGGSSITVTLPKKWIEKNGLTDKDLLKVSYSDSAILVLQPLTNKKIISRSRIKLDGLTDKMLVRELIAHYISGVDDITLQGVRISPEQRTKIRELSNFLTGFEIIDESAEKIIMRNIFDPSKFPVHKNIEKMFFTTISMFKDALNALMENDKALATDVIQRDYEIDKLYLVIKRQEHSLEYNKISQEEIGLNLSDLHYYKDVATQLERIADHAVKITRAVENFDKKSVHLSSSFTNAADKITILLNKSQDMVKKMDRKLAHEILDRNSEIKKLTINFDKMRPEEMFILNLIEDSFDRVRGYTTNIAEITIDQSVEKENK